ncbi:AhpD family alkylhydroperoxidase [Mucilaginibacter sp. SG564]|nr:AhpD family alkylhydroperoxidase [Mucilaginibacter sp. SG564]
MTARKREVINLVVSQVNECAYCLIAHTVAGGLQGFTTEEILLIRKANIDFDTRLGTLAKFVKATAINSGLPDAALVDYFLAADYSEAHLIDMILVKEIKRSVITCTALSFFL